MCAMNKVPTDLCEGRAEVPTYLLRAALVRRGQVKCLLRRNSEDSSVHNLPANPPALSDETASSVSPGPGKSWSSKRWLEQQGI